MNDNEVKEPRTVQPKTRVDNEMLKADLKSKVDRGEMGIGEAVEEYLECRCGGYETAREAAILYAQDAFCWSPHWAALEMFDEECSEGDFSAVLDDLDQFCGYMGR